MLTDLLLGIIVTGGMLYGLYLMRQLDDWRMQEQELKKKEEIKRRTAIVFGMKEKKELTDWFEKVGVETVWIEGIYAQPMLDHVCCVIAAGEADIDNLSVLNLFRQMYPQAETFGVCNERANRKLYKQAGFTVFCHQEELLQRLELLLMEHEAGVA